MRQSTNGDQYSRKQHAKTRTLKIRLIGSCQARVSSSQIDEMKSKGSKPTKRGNVENEVIESNTSQAVHCANNENEQTDDIKAQLKSRPG